MGIWSCFCGNREEEDTLPPVPTTTVSKQLPPVGSRQDQPPIEEKEKKEDKGDKGESDGDDAVARVKETSHLLLWEKAADLARTSDRLSKDEIALITKKGDGPSTSSPLFDVISEARHARKQLLDKKMVYTTRDGKEVDIQGRLERLIGGLQNYADMIDGLVAASEYAALVWTAMKFFFQAGPLFFPRHARLSADRRPQIIWNKLEMLERLEDVLARIVLTMAVCQVYESIYAECRQLARLQTDKKTAANIAALMESALPELHAAVLVFSIKAWTYFGRASSITGLFAAVVPFEQQFQPYVDRIEQEKQTVKTLADVASKLTTAEISDKIKGMDSQLEKIESLLAPLGKKLDEIYSEVKGTKSEIISFRAAQGEQLDQKALEWLHARHPDESLLAHNSRRVQGTCEWILRTPAYQQWESSSSESESLWICGQAGTGKTVMASFLAEHLQQAKDTNALVFFFGAGGTNDASPIAALSSLILQLIHLSGKHDERLRGTFLENLKSTVSKGVGFTNRGKTVPALQDLLASMLETIKGHSKRVVVILDALDACSEPEALVGSPGSRLRDASARIITSRPTGLATDFLHGSLQVRKVPMCIEDDMAILVDARTAAHPGLLRQKATICSMLQTSSTLDFAAVLLDKLGALSPDAAEDQLAGLQRELDRAQDAGPLPSASALDRAAWLGHHISLQLLLDDCSQPPVSSQQLARAVSYAWKQGHVEAVRVLVGYRVGNSLVGAEVAGGLLRSAAVDDESGLVALLAGLPEVDANGKDGQGRSALSLAAEKGHDAVVQALLAQPGIDVNVQENTDDTPLIWAAYNGHGQCVRLLLAHPDIKANMRNNFRITALQYSVRYAYVDIVRMLLAVPGIAVNTLSNLHVAPIHETPLKAPSGSAGGRYRYNECLKLLLARPDVDVNVRHNSGDTVLTTAVYWDFYEQVALLLTRPDLDRSPVNNAGETPLSLARRMGHERIVALLT